VKFSVVIPTYNRKATLRQTLAALSAQGYSDYELIVIDDGSTDGTRAMVAAEFPAACYKHQNNHGPAAARNVGIKAARGDIVAFTDDDCVAPTDWLARLADGYARYPNAAGVGGYLEAPESVLTRETLARYETFIARTVYGVNASEQFTGFSSPTGGTNNLSYRLSVLEQVHGFDETFRYAAGEDADLKWRICELGHQLLYTPVKMTHMQDYSWARLRRQSYFRGRGRTQFEIRRGHKPSYPLLLARLTRALVVFPRDRLTMPERSFALAKCIERVWGVSGQWNQLRYG
jgi:glycosyltransferase involved in cell wall biosynthesis